MQIDGLASLANDHGHFEIDACCRPINSETGAMADINILAGTHEAVFCKAVPLGFGAIQQET